MIARREKPLKVNLEMWSRGGDEFPKEHGNSMELDRVVEVNDGVEALDIVIEAHCWLGSSKV